MKIEFVCIPKYKLGKNWIPAFAGMTTCFGICNC